MHRKIVVIDAHIAFIGGLNYSAEHMSSYGPEAKQDYAVRLEGPIVEDILQFELENLPGQSAARRWWRRHHKAEENRQPGEAQVLLVWRDNEEHRDDIERHYLKMLTQARREVIIANAYFFPGYRFLHALRKAARRGVRIKLIIRANRICRLSESARACCITIWLKAAFRFLSIAAARSTAKWR